MDKLGWPDPDRRDDALARLQADVDYADILTPMESRCLQAASIGLEAKAIGAVCGIGTETAKTHLRFARRKLRAKNTCHACCEALRRGLIR